MGELVEIPIPPGGYSASFLRTDGELNRAVAYIVPIQQRLDPLVSHDAGDTLPARPSQYVHNVG